MGVVDNKHPLVVVSFISKYIDLLTTWVWPILKAVDLSIAVVLNLIQIGWGASTYLSVGGKKRWTTN